MSELADDNSPALGVYVHWPYCARICPYCDFNVYRNRSVDAARWKAALVRDLEHWAAQTKGRRLTGLYFGGGTPSLAPIEVIGAVIEACAQLWGFEDNPEISIETNPTDAEFSRFRSFAAAGVNRLSLGVQSFDDAALAFLGRDHDAASARRGLDRALKIFSQTTFDLIYALPGQTAEEWRRTLGQALQIGAPHLSLYQLTIEQGTAFEKAVGRGKWAPPADDRAAELFDIAQELTAAAGLPAYEISNHARPGAESRHNLLYWRYADYVGVGPGAHGRLTLDGERLATAAHERPEAYLDAVETKGTGAETVETLDAGARMVERFAMGLRLAEGIALADDDFFFADPARAARLADCIADGLLVHDSARIAASPRGRRLLNAVLNYLFG